MKNLRKGVIIGMLAMTCLFSCKKEEVEPVITEDPIEIVYNCGIIVDSGLDTIVINGDNTAEYWVDLENINSGNTIKIIRSEHECSFPTRSVVADSAGYDIIIEHFYYLDNGDTLCILDMQSW